jgi:hypothetical protein
MSRTASGHLEEVRIRSRASSGVDYRMVRTSTRVESHSCVDSLVCKCSCKDTAVGIYEGEIG